MTFHKHEYFSSEDLDLSNPTKFSLHFSTFFYTFSKFSAEINNFWKTKQKLKRGLTSESHMPVGAQLPAPSPALRPALPRRGHGHGHGVNQGSWGLGSH